MFLDQIVPVKRQEVEALKQHLQVQKGEKKVSSLPPCRNLYQSLTSGKRSLGLMAEVKKSSPSKGLIRENFVPREIAASYEKAGADAISVLTDVSFFQGNIDYLEEVKRVVQIPVFRKDFIIDEIQVLQARLRGADALLLIAAILEENRMKQLADYCSSLGMQYLVEVHNDAELEKTLRLAPQIIGINNRDLHTFHTDLKTTERLLPLIPDHVAVVSESGLNNSRDVRMMKERGVSAILVGEHFMRQDNIEEAVGNLMQEV